MAPHIIESNYDLIFAGGGRLLVASSVCLLWMFRRNYGVYYRWPFIEGGP